MSPHNQSDRPARRLRPGAALLVALMMFGAGAAAGALTALKYRPDELKPAMPATVMPVVQQEFTDPRNVSLVADIRPGARLLAHQTGVLTRFDCQVGRTLDSGTSPWAINGGGVLALHTTTPLYRDLAVGDRGPDVTALRTELARLGQPVSAGEAVDVATVTAVGTLLGHPIDGIRLADISWLPAPTVTIATCLSTLGAPVTSGTPIVESRGIVAGLKVAPMPTNLVGGPRVVVVGQTRGAAELTGEVAAADVDAIVEALGRELVQSAASGAPVSLAATWQLATPMRAAVVPVSAVFGQADQTCVADPDGRVYPVTVVDSSLGRSTIQMRGETTPSVVALSRPETLACTLP